MSAGDRVDHDARMPHLFSALLACYSRHFRAQFGDELASVIAAVWAESREQSPLARVRLAIRLAVDLTLGVVADRVGRLVPSGEPGRGIRRSRRLLPPLLDSALVDTRIAVRALRQHRTFALTVILTLGVGIGGVTAMWSMVYAARPARVSRGGGRRPAGQSSRADYR